MTQLEPMPPGGKPAVQSMTILSGAVAFLGIVLPPVLTALKVTPADAQASVSDLGQIAAALGSILAIYGRWRATQAITSITPPKP